VARGARVEPAPKTRPVDGAHTAFKRGEVACLEAGDALKDPRGDGEAQVRPERLTRVPAQENAARLDLGHREAPRGRLGGGRRLEPEATNTEQFGVVCAQFSTRTRRSYSMPRRASTKR
jgi:hypothetical protein